MSLKKSSFTTLSLNIISLALLFLIATVCVNPSILLVYSIIFSVERYVFVKVIYLEDGNISFNSSNELYL